MLISSSLWHLQGPHRTRFTASWNELVCFVRLFVLWEDCHMVSRNKSGSGWAEDVCLAQAGGQLTATHHLGADTCWNTHTHTHTRTIRNWVGLKVSVFRCDCFHLSCCCRLLPVVSFWLSETEAVSKNTGRQHRCALCCVAAVSVYPRTRLRNLGRVRASVLVRMIWLNSAVSGASHKIQVRSETHSHTVCVSVRSDPKSGYSPPLLNKMKNVQHNILKLKVRSNVLCPTNTSKLKIFTLL